MTTPKCLEKFDDYETDYIRRFMEKENLDVRFAMFFDKFFRDVIAEADFCIRVHLQTLPQIISDGRLKNVVECGKGATVGGPRARCEVTRWLFGCDTSALEPCDYPIFGYLGPKNKCAELGNDMSYQYGNVVLTLKRENIWKRTTMTVGDTVNFAAFHRVMPTRISNPHFTCASWMLHDENMTSMSMNLPVTYKYHLLAQALIDQKYSAKDFFKLNAVLGDYNGFEFYELQIHGGVSVPRDIERIDFIEVYDDDELAIVNQAKEALKDIPMSVNPWIRKKEPETGNQEPGTRNQEPGTRN